MVCFVCVLLSRLIVAESSPNSRHAVAFCRPSSLALINSFYVCFWCNCCPVLPLVLPGWQVSGCQPGMHWTPAAVRPAASRGWCRCCASGQTLTRHTAPTFIHFQPPTFGLYIFLSLFCCLFSPYADYLCIYMCCVLFFRCRRIFVGQRV